MVKPLERNEGLILKNKIQLSDVNLVLPFIEMKN